MIVRQGPFDAAPSGRGNNDAGRLSHGTAGPHPCRQGIPIPLRSCPVAAWRELPEAIRRAILALVESTRYGSKADHGPAVLRDGRPGRSGTESERLHALSEAIRAEDWRAIIAKAREQAKAGDHKARDWLGRYLLDNAPAPEHAG